MTHNVKKIILREGLIFVGVIIAATLVFFIVSSVKVHPRWSYGEWWWHGLILFLKWLYLPYVIIHLCIRLVIWAERKLDTKNTPSKPDVIKSDRKKNGIIAVVIILLLGVILLLLGSGKVFESLKNVKKAIATQEQFIGLTREQVVGRFGKPATFQNIGLVKNDGQSEKIEIITYPIWNWRIVVVLKNNIVTEVNYEMHPSLKRKLQQKK